MRHVGLARRAIRAQRKPRSDVIGITWNDVRICMGEKKKVNTVREWESDIGCRGEGLVWRYHGRGWSVYLTDSPSECLKAWEGTRRAHTPTHAPAYTHTHTRTQRCSVAQVRRPVTVQKAPDVCCKSARGR